MAKTLKMRLEPWQNPKSQPYIHLENVSKHFGRVEAVNNVTLSVYKNEFFSLLGGSGCGKTTLLRLLAGFEEPTSGRIYIDGINITAVPPYERPVNMMFQSYALFPHMNVEENVVFGLKQDRLSARTIQGRAKELLALVNMEGYQDRKPHELSGGQRQRVALARSLARRPKVLLLDEPLAALDKTLREQTQFELVNIQEEMGITFVMVTHDQEEAMTVSTRMGIMSHGRIVQVGTPSEIYEYPNSLDVAKFIGSMNIFEGLVVDTNKDLVSIRCENTKNNLYVRHGSALAMGAHVFIAVRPEKVMLFTEKPPQDTNCAKGIVQDIAYLGDVSIYHVELPSGKIILATHTNAVRLAQRPITWEDTVFVSWAPENAIILMV